MRREGGKGICGRGLSLPRFRCYTTDMEPNTKYPKRKPLRLKNYDYSTPGAYFITICTAGKKCMLSTVVGDVIRVLKSMSIRQARPYWGKGPLFQRFYYDHIIRNEKDYGEVWAYIEENPLRWAEDDLFAED